MLISTAIFSLTEAVGVGFLLNSTSSRFNWSCVALCLFWFFCCWVRVLLRGGRRVLELLLVEMEMVGEGVVGDIPDSPRRSSDDILEGVRKSEQMLLIVASLGLP